jgi:FkbM family methyltransferase
MLYIRQNISRILRLGPKVKTLIYLRHARAQIVKSFDLPGTIGKQTIKLLLPQNPVIVEVGAHVGIDTLEFAAMYPRGKVLSFEPQIDLYVEAVSRTRSVENVTIYPYAISSEFGIHKFYVSSGTSTGSSSLLNPTKHLTNHPDVIFDQGTSQMVLTAPLDLICAHLGVHKIDLLWIDTQGAELMVLKGAVDMLASTSFIYLECSIESLYEGAATYTEIKTFLEDNGFSLKKEFMPADWGGEGNALFSRAQKGIG